MNREEIGKVYRDMGHAYTMSLTGWWNMRQLGRYGRDEPEGHVAVLWVCDVFPSLRNGHGGVKTYQSIETP